MEAGPLKFKVLKNTVCNINFRKLSQMIKDKIITFEGNQLIVSRKNTNGAFSTKFKTILKGLYCKDTKKQKEKSPVLLRKKELMSLFFGIMQAMAVCLKSSTLC